MYIAGSTIHSILIRQHTYKEKSKIINSRKIGMVSYEEEKVLNITQNQQNSNNGKPTKPLEQMIFFKSFYGNFWYL